ncbi:hypothetical protein [Sphingomonas melonis]|uniref:Putative SOS response-associated peptidase YedK n=1 Tax=Sphingomonas melonis TaxID=152682 RepID=A0A7Y9FKU5_9SPHN|nr:hypothetical protein [Sphingomonas melonis]NYD89168.1 putative SOS response-associated peptidase YedK [Sphingomonas melonis]
MEPHNRCVVSLTEFRDWTPDKHEVGERAPIKGEMWFDVSGQPGFAVAVFRQRAAKAVGFTMFTCDPNGLVAAARPKAMMTIPHEADCIRLLRGS